jgi:hypothetical protein
MKDGLRFLSSSMLVLGFIYFFQKSVDAKHAWWVFVIEGLVFLMGLAILYAPSEGTNTSVKEGP